MPLPPIQAKRCRATKKYAKLSQDFRKNPDNINYWGIIVRNCVIFCVNNYSHILWQQHTCKLLCQSQNWSGYKGEVNLRMFLQYNRQVILTSFVIFTMAMLFLDVYLLVSTYVVCERLSVMHEPAGVVEILVQILPEYPLFWSRVSEYPPPPENENCQRVQIREFQNTPPMKIVRESKSKSFRIPPPPNENCQRVQIRVSEYPPPPIGKTSDLKLQNSLKIREIYVETNL